MNHLPKNWKTVQLDSLTLEERAICYGVVQPGPEDENGVLFIRSGDIEDGIVTHSLRTITKKVADQYRRTRLVGGELVISLVGYPGQSAIVPVNLAGANVARQVGVIALKSDVNAEYVQHFLASPIGQQALLYPTIGSAQQVINISELKRISVLLPPIDEQRSISRVINTWDRGIRQLSDLIAAKVRFKQGLMQQLLTGKRRFPEFKGKWNKVRLNDVAEESSERNRGRLGTESVMAVTKAAGIVPMRERTIAADIDRYSMVRRDEFAYNPMRLNIGSIARWTGENEILVSPDYVVFRCKTDSEEGTGIDPDFLDQYRRSSLWESFVTSSGNGSVRVRIYFDDLGRIKINLPSLPEQRKIANFLITIDREIELLRQELEALKAQKKGLMQKLLTGQIRVPFQKENSADV